MYVKPIRKENETRASELPLRKDQFQIHKHDEISDSYSGIDIRALTRLYPKLESTYVNDVEPRGRRV